MNKTKTNTRDKQISIELKNGEAFIWDSNSNNLELEEFLNWAVNGLGQDYGYDRLIFAHDAKEDGAGNSPPKAVATCRGDEEAFKTVIMFNECGLICAVRNKPKG